MHTFFHGSKQPLTAYSATRGESDAPDMLFFSVSPNVARRYGHQVYGLSIDTQNLPRMSVEDWQTGAPLPEGNFIIAATPSSFDYPVDTLVLREPPSSPLTLVPPARLVELDDGLAFRDPQFVGDRNWKEYVNDFHPSTEDFQEELNEAKKLQCNSSPGIGG